MRTRACLAAAIATTVFLTASSRANADSSLEPPNPTNRSPIPNRAPLAQIPFIPLPVGAIRPEGWLKRQLDLQKSGLTGSAENLYDALTPNSAWLGGDGESWEKGPYYVRGLIALAYTLDDPALKSRAQKWIDWTLSSQRDDGFFGPKSNDDWWPRMVVLFYLRDYYEATNDPRVLPFFTKYFHYQLAQLPKRHLRDWGKARAGDNIDVVLWTYNLTADPSLLDLAKLLHKQAYPWQSIYSANRFYSFGGDFQPHHIVNVNQALKFAPVSFEFTHDAADRSALSAGLNNLDQHYGRIDGNVSGTEMLSSRSSTAGVELCADVERIISLQIAETVLGDPTLGDRIEKVAYNSLPAHTSPTMHQITYYQLPNQISAVIGGHGFNQDYPNGNVPGPHSGFPCCCYNWHAGWPKFVAGMWAATSDNGLATMTYGPNHVTAKVAGVPITITEETDYPFKENITLRISPERAVSFPLLLRIPAWCDKPTITVNGAAISDVHSATFLRIDRSWNPGDVVELNFPMPIRTSTWINDSVGIERGPLAFALKIGEDWKSIHPYPVDFDEYEVRPTSPWNYALQINRESPDVAVHVQNISDIPFATDAAPVELTIPAHRLTNWTTRQAPGRAVLRRASHRWEQLIDAPAPGNPDSPHHLKVEAKSNLIRLFVDDMTHPVIEQDDSTFPTGSVGLRAYDSTAEFTDIKLNGKPADDFTHPGAWKSFGGPWTPRGAAYTITATKDAKTLLTTATDLRDFTFEATIKVSPGGDAGLLFHVTDPTPNLDGYNGYYLGLSTRAGKSPDSAEPPPSPVKSNEPIESVKLIPFGSGKLRISYFPVLDGK